MHSHAHSTIATHACALNRTFLSGEFSLERKKKAESGNLSKDFTRNFDIFGEDFLRGALLDGTREVVGQVDRLVGWLIVCSVGRSYTRLNDRMAAGQY